MARATTVGCPAREPGLGGLVFYGLRVRLGPSYLLVYPTMGQPSSPHARLSNGDSMWVTEFPP